jgi:hypothetical protein
MRKVFISSVLTLALFFTTTSTTSANSNPNDQERLREMVYLNRIIKRAIAEGEITLVSTGSCSSCTSQTGTNAVDGVNGWVKFTIPEGKTGLVRYITALPIDPNNRNYYYEFASDGVNFELNAEFESPQYYPLAERDGGNSSSIFELGTDPGKDLL